MIGVAELATLIIVGLMGCYLCEMIDKKK